MKRTIIYVWIFLCMVAFPQVYAQSFDYQMAINEALIADNMIKTVKGKMLFTIADSSNTLVINNAISYKYEHVGERLWFNMKDNINKSKISKSFDGEKTTTLNIAVDNKGLIHQSASISDNIIGEPLITPFGFGYYIFRRDVSDMLKNRSISCGEYSVKNVRYIKSENIENRSTDMFCGDASDNQPFIIWLSKDLLYRPVKVIASGYIFYIKYKIVMDVFFPDDVEISSVSVANGRIIEGKHNIKIDYIIEETSINAAITKEDFQINIPDGLNISDLRKK